MAELNSGQNAAPEPLLKSYPLGTDWVYLTVVEEAHIGASLRGWVPIAKVRDPQGREGWLYLSAYSLYKHLREDWERRGRRFLGMAFWVRKEAAGRKFAPFEVSWTAPA